MVIIETDITIRKVVLIVLVYLENVWESNDVEILLLNLVPDEGVAWAEGVFRQVWGEGFSRWIYMVGQRIEDLYGVWLIAGT